MTQVDINSPAFQEEIFGPVLPMVNFKDLDDAIEIANNSRFGLQAAIFTNNFQSMMNASMKLDVATVVVNHPSAMRIECLPFGGRKTSGNGREGVIQTLKDMSELKTIIMPNAFSVYSTQD